MANNSVYVVAAVRLIVLVSVTLLASFSIKTQTAGIFPVPENFRTEGIPPISQADAERVLFDPAKIGGNLIWDADYVNRRLLVTDQTNAMHLLESPMAKPRPIGAGIIPSIVRFRPNSKDFAFLSDHEDEDNFHLYLYEVSSDKTRRLSPKSGDDGINGFVWSRDGGRAFFALNDYKTKTSRICVAAIESTQCFDEVQNGVWEVMAEFGTELVLKYWFSSSDQRLYRFDLASKKITDLSVTGNNRRVGVGRDAVYWSNEGDPQCGSNACVLYRRRQDKTSRPLGLPRIEGSLHDLKVSPDGRYLMVLEIRDGIDRLRVFDLRNLRKIRELRAVNDPSEVIWHTRWLGASELVYTVEHVGKPASIHSFDFKSGKKTDWTTERMPAELAGRLAKPEPIKWKSFDGKLISGFIVTPADRAGPRPVVIFVHGGPQVLDRPIFNASETALVSALGIAVIHTNIRGSSGISRDFLEADDQGKRGDAVKDIRALFDFIETRPDLDSNRIAIRGQSYGGFIALATGLAEPRRVKAVVAEYPLVSIRGLVSMPSADESLFAEYGDPKDEVLMKKLDALSPLNNAVQWNRIPLLLTRGKRDERNPEANVVDLKDQLRGSGSEVWWIYSLDAGHGVSGRYVNVALYQFLKNKITEIKK